MSLASACLWTLTRTVFLCLLAWPICVGIERWIRGVSDARRPLAFALLLAPFLFPELLVGYTYRDAALHSPRLAEWLCVGLLLIRIVPVGVVTLLASPSSLASAAAIYCRWMLLRVNPGSVREWQQFASCYWHGPVRRALPALGLMSLVAFQEFELAALLQAASWTDWFIAAQRVGLDRNEMLIKSFWPVLMQLPLLVGVVCWSVRGQELFSELNDEPSVALPATADRGMKVYLGLAFIAGCLIPLGFMVSNLPSGLKLIVRQPTQLTGLVREILIAATVSLCASLTAWSVSHIVLNPKRGRPLSSFVRRGLLFPGLAGSLLLSLATVALFQQPWLRPMYDTPIPWVFALIIWLLPRAVLVRLWLDSIARTEGVRLAEMLESRRLATDREPTTDGDRPSSINRFSTRASRRSVLLFRLRDQPRLLAIGLLCYWAYLDLSTAYLLAPSGMASGLVRLYNFMHFGRSSALSAEAFLFFGIPMVVTYLALLVGRVARRQG